MIRRNLRLCSGEYGENGRFSDGGQADKPDIRNRFELQLDLILRRFDARLGKARCLMRRRCKLCVALAAASAAEDDPLLVSLAHVREDGAALHVPHNGTDGDANHQRFTVFARAELRLARLTVFRAVESLKLKIQQCGHMRIGKKHEVAAAPAVSAIRPAHLYIFFTVKGGVPVSAVSGFHDDARFIDKLHGVT